MTKCPRPACRGDIITDWNERKFCLLCNREVDVPEPPVFVLDETKPFVGGFYRRRGKALKCTCWKRRACKKHVGVGV